MKSNLDHANAARLANALAKLYRFHDGSGVMTLGEWLEFNRPQFTHKAVCTEQRTKRVQVYEPGPLGRRGFKDVPDPRVYYAVRLANETSLEIPKMVWDTLALPIVEKSVTMW